MNQAGFKSLQADNWKKLKHLLTSKGTEHIGMALLTLQFQVQNILIHTILYDTCL